MDLYESLSHTKWECKYHVVFIPGCAGRSCCMGSCGGILGQCFENWRNERNAESRKAT